MLRLAVLFVALIISGCQNNLRAVAELEKVPVGDYQNLQLTPGQKIVFGYLDAAITSEKDEWVGMFNSPWEKKALGICYEIPPVEWGVLKTTQTCRPLSKADGETYGSFFIPMVPGKYRIISITFNRYSISPRDLYIVVPEDAAEAVYIGDIHMKMLKDKIGLQATNFYFGIDRSDKSLALLKKKYPGIKVTDSLVDKANFRGFSFTTYN